MRFIRKAAALALAAAIPVPAFAATNGWQSRVAAAFGKPGVAMPGGLYRVALPRTDLKVMLDGVRIKPALALGGWLAFEKAAGGGMVMGDLVLTGNEVNPVLKALVDHGIVVTAIHNHMIGEKPRLVFVHFWANADAETLARGLKAALAHAGTAAR